MKNPAKRSSADGAEYAESPQGNHMNHSTPSATSTMDLSCQAWDIYNILVTLHVALPCDSVDSEVPTKCLIAHVINLADALASELMEAV